MAQAFTPGAPIDRLSLFAGRLLQVQDVVSAVSQKGQHVGLYGERGVGKTSLANVLHEFFAAPDLPQFQSAFVNCNSDDTYDSIWRNVFRELELEAGSTLSPEDVRYEIERLGTPALVVIDELDRLQDDDALTLLADTIKTLSHHTVASTIVLVGVARSIGDLIGEHESIVRNLVQVQIPRMTQKELREIVEKGCASAELTAGPEAVDKITLLSEGLPHYTHLLALYSAQRVVQDDRTEITLADVNAAIPQAVERHTIQSDYLRATRSTQPDALYRQVLLACALARKNQLGYFPAGAIRDPLAVIAGRRIEIPQFARHLKQFLQPERGSVLHREGESRHFFYRFTDPILQPYVILTGLADGLISDAQLIQIQGDAAVPTDSAPEEPQSLF
ncbi:MAG: ATP-binding protein [Gaiellaceae bacterium]